MGKKIKTILFSALIMGILYTGSVSARQLSLNVQTTTCGGFCDSKNTIAPTFWVADASFSPDSRAAPAISSRPGRGNSWAPAQL